MTNLLSVLIYVPFCVGIAALFVSSLRMDGAQFFVGMFRLYCLIMLCWFVAEIAYFVLPWAEAVRAAFDVKLIFVAILPVIVFAMMASFFRVIPVFPRWLFAVLLVIPAVTTVLVITSPLHSLLLVDFEVLSLSPLTASRSVRGAWFYVHTVYSQGLVFAVAAVVIAQHRRLPHAYRSGASLLFTGLFVYFLCTLLETFRLDGGSSIDMNLIGACVSGVLFYLVTLVKGKIDCMHIDDTEAFDALDEAVFMLDASGRIIAGNRACQRLDLGIGKQGGTVRLSHRLAQMEGERLLVRRLTEGDTTEDLYFLKSQPPMIFQMRNHPMLDRRRVPAGRYAIFTDVTNDRVFVERLREAAGVDPLTGIANRNGYMRMLRECDRPERLPLSIVIGRIDGLRFVNDRRGHSVGDIWLKEGAERMLRRCPDGAGVARIGGDMFAMVAPDCPREKAQGIMDGLREDMEEGEGLRVPILLRAVTKEERKTNITLLAGDLEASLRSGDHPQKEGSEGA